MTLMTPAAQTVANFLDLVVSPLRSVPFVPDRAPIDSVDGYSDDTNDADYPDDYFEGADHSNEESAGGYDQQPRTHVMDWAVREFGNAPHETVAAVDANMTRLGVTSEGIVVALRAVCTIDSLAGNSSANHLRTGSLHLRMVDRDRLLHQMGIAQGAPEFFVQLIGDPPLPFAKSGAANHTAILADRVRNHIERIMQVHALRQLPPGALLLLDSSLTQRTRDTSPEWWAVFTEAAATGRISLVAVSKRSILTVQDRPVSFWLDDVPERACYRRLTTLLHNENPARAARNLGGLYAVRFSPLGPTLRVDVLAADGRNEAEVLDAVVSSCTIRGGMPEPLVRAHAHAYITSPAFQVLQADAVSTWGLDPRTDAKLGPAVFGFSAGRHK